MSLTFKTFLVESVTTLADVKSFARKAKVDLGVSNLSSGVWHLEGIERLEGSNPGDGAKVLRLLLKAAKQHKKKVLLYAENKRLVQYYESLGFVPLKDRTLLPNWWTGQTNRYMIK